MKCHTALKRGHNPNALWLWYGLSTLILAFMPTQSTGQTISTVIGAGTADNVPAASAALYDPTGVSADGAGNIYIADFRNHRVRKVDPAGTITTVAGTGTAGYSGDGGPAASATLNSPYRTSVDAAGNIYIAEQFNHVIRKVDPAGIITTIAGTGIAGYSGDSGPATSAQISNPLEVLTDAAGNIYIGDNGNRRIRKIDPAGTITTIAGTGSPVASGDGGPAINAGFSLNDIALDGAGNLYIADSSNHRIRKIDTFGIITTIVGDGTASTTGDGGLAVNATQQNPTGVHADAAGDLYITGSDRVRKVDSAGIINTVAGSTKGIQGDGGPATAARLHYTNDVYVDGAGSLYIADFHNHRIRKVDPAGIITTVAGGGAGDGGPVSGANLNGAYGIFVDVAGNTYIADGRYHRVQRPFIIPIHMALGRYTPRIVAIYTASHPIRSAGAGSRNRWGPGLGHWTGWSVAARGSAWEFSPVAVWGTPRSPSTPAPWRLKHPVSSIGPTEPNRGAAYRRAPQPKRGR